MNKGLQTVKKFHEDIYQILPQLKSSMIDLTLKWEQKSLNNINKQFQDCIINYFFEDIVGDLIKQDFQFQIKTQIKQHFMEQISNEISKKHKNQTYIYHQLKNKNQKLLAIKKYMLLPQKYIQEIILQRKEEDYVSLLSKVALEKITFEIDEQRWRSQIRKKTFAAILLVHFYNDYPLQTIFEMWDNTFPSQSIKKQKKSALVQKTTVQKPAFNQKQKPQILQERNSINFDKNLHPKSNSDKLFTQSCEKKCYVVDINEPILSKQEQFDHYLGNFPPEEQIYDINLKMINQTDSDSLSFSNITNYINEDSNNNLLYSASNFEDNNQQQYAQFVDERQQNYFQNHIDFNQNNSDSFKQNYQQSINYNPINNLNLSYNHLKNIEQKDQQSQYSFQEQTITQQKENIVSQKQIKQVYSSNNICTASEDLVSNYIQFDYNQTHNRSIFNSHNCLDSQIH